MNTIDRNAEVARMQAKVIWGFICRNGGETSINTKQPGRLRAIAGLKNAGLIQAAQSGNTCFLRLTEAGWVRAGVARKAELANARAGRLAVEAANAEAEADRLAMKADFAAREREQETAAFESKMRRDEAIASGNEERRSAALELGTYTVVDADGGYITIKVRKGFENRPGSQIVAYLNGPDNETCFEAVGTISNGRFFPWARCRDDRRIGEVERAVRFLLSASGEAREVAGYEYALKSGRCSKCGRKLTVPVSIHRGMGPECAKNFGA